MRWRVAKPEDWDSKTAIVLAHGAGQGIDSPFMTFFHQELARRGFLSVMFNFDYMENKRKVPDPMSRLQARYREVVEEVSGQYRPKVMLTGGKSMGGRVASYIAGGLPDLHGLIFLGYPLHPPGKPEQLRDAHLYEIRKPMLFLTGTRDPFADHQLLEDVVRKIGSYATLNWVEGGDHSLKVRKSGVNSLTDAAQTIRDWIQKNF